MRYFDLAIIVAYLAGVTWLGTHFKTSRKSLKDYFLGGHSAPWWALALSIVSAETSTLTVIGTPTSRLPVTSHSFSWCSAICSPASSSRC